MDGPDNDIDNSSTPNKTSSHPINTHRRNTLNHIDTQTKSNKYDVVSNEFFRTTQFALRMACTFITSSMIVYGTDYGSTIQAPYIIPVMSALIGNFTLGQTIAGSLTLMKTIIPVSIFVYIIQLCGVGYHDYTSVTILFLLVTFYTAYLNPLVITRKLALLLPVIFFTTIVNTPSNILGQLFAFQLLESFTVGIIFAIAFSMFILPRTSTLELQDRMSYCLNSIHTMYTLTMHAYLCSNKAESQALLNEANLVLAYVLQSSQQMRLRTAELQTEPAVLIRRLFRSKQSAYIRHQQDKYIEIVGSLTFHVQSMIYTCNHVMYNQRHEQLAELCHESFENLIQQQQLIFDSITVTSHIQDIEYITQQIIQLNSLYIKLTHTYTTALMKLNNIAVDYSTHAVRMQNDGEHISSEGLANLHDLSHKHTHCHIHDTDDAIANRKDPLTFGHFMFHVHEIVRALDRNFNTKYIPYHNTDTTADTPHGTSIKSKLQQYITPMKHMTWKGLYNCLKLDWTKVQNSLRCCILLGVGLIFVEVPILAQQFEHGQWILIAMCMTQGDNVGGSVTQMRLRLIGTLLGAVYGYLAYSAVGNNMYYLLAMLLLWVFVMSYIRASQNYAYIGVIGSATAIIVTIGRIPYTDPIQGNYALLRIQQNSLGIAIALVVNLVVFPVLASDLIKHNISVVLNNMSIAVRTIYTVYDTTIQTHSVMKHTRNNNTHTLVLPELQRQQSDKYLILNELSGQQIDIKTDSEFGTFIFSEIGKIRQQLSQQQLLITQADSEPRLWSTPFPTTSYRTLVDNQTFILRCIFTIDRAMLRITQTQRDTFHLFGLEFADRVRVQLHALINIVANVLDVWSILVDNSMLLQHSENTQIPDDLIGLWNTTQLKRRRSSTQDYTLADNKYNDQYIQYINQSSSNNQSSKQRLSKPTRVQHQSLMIKLHDAEISLRNQHRDISNESIEQLRAHHTNHTVADSHINTHTSTSHITVDQLHYILAEQTTLNALFYGATHLVQACISTCNTLYAIQEVERANNYTSY